MTVQRKDWFKRNFISLTNLILLVGLVAQQAQWQKGVDKDIENLLKHSNSKVTHMPLEEKIKIFVTRFEHNEFSDKLDVINSKVDLLLSKAVNGN